MSITSRLRSPEEIALNAGMEVPRLLLPKADVFAEQALRLRQLAANHPMRDYLMLMAVVAEAQSAQLPTYPEPALPTAAQADTASQQGVQRRASGRVRWRRRPAARGQSG